MAFHPIGFKKGSGSATFPFYVSDVEGIPFAYWESLNTNDGPQQLLNAENDVLADFSAFIGSDYVNKAPFNGAIGNPSVTQYLPAPLDNILRLPIKLYNLKGGTLKITAISLLLDTSASVVIDLDNENGDYHREIDFVVVGRSSALHPLTEPWIIPADGQTYTLTAHIPTGVRVGRNKLNCGCGKGLGGLLAMGSFNETQDAAGFAMLAQTNCSYDQLTEQLLDNEKYRRVLERMVAYRCALRMLSIPPNDQIERSTVLSADDIAKLVVVYDNEYTTRLDWFKAKKPEVDTSMTCLAPKPGVARMGGLFR